MRAAVCTTYGPPEVVEIQDIPSPPVGPGQAKVRVEAAAINFPDTLVIANTYQVSAPVPFVPGSEFAGEVIELGGDGTTIAVGDRVIGSTFVGAFAEEVVVDAAVLTRIPAGVDAHHAAAFGVAHRTAYHVLRSVAELQPGEELVVLGAAGGVGLAAVKLGVALGATVTAVASEEWRLEAARTQGATRLVDVESGDLRQALKDALPNGGDVVVDPVGGPLSEPALRCLRWGGRFVTIGYASGEIPRIPLNLVMLKGVQIRGFQFRDFASNAPEQFERNERELLDMLASGSVVPHIGATFPLNDTAVALRHVADGKAIGKVIIEM